MIGGFPPSAEFHAAKNPSVGASRTARTPATVLRVRADIAAAGESAQSALAISAARAPAPPDSAEEGKDAGSIPRIEKSNPGSGIDSSAKGR